MIVSTLLRPSRAASSGPCASQLPPSGPSGLAPAVPRPAEASSGTEGICCRWAEGPAWKGVREFPFSVAAIAWEVALRRPMSTAAPLEQLEDLVGLAGSDAEAAEAAGGDAAGGSREASGAGSRAAEHAESRVWSPEPESKKGPLFPQVGGETVRVDHMPAGVQLAAAALL